ncbi:MAG: ATP synthase F1 subunit delta [Clostridiales bacterium]|nr:ATP synthase F1 subunit delta [Candidatus Crickella merdequi]
MAELTVDLTYGTALYEAARETGKVQLILDEGREMLDIIDANEDLRLFINFPTISAEEKKNTLTAIFEGQICKELLNFLYVLIDKRRVAHLKGIMKVYEGLTQKEDGYSYGTVYSVVPLSAERMAEVEAKASDLLKTKVKLENELDPQLIGGVKLLVDGKLIDASLRKKFDDMASQIKNS